MPMLRRGRCNKKRVISKPFQATGYRQGITRLELVEMLKWGVVDGINVCLFLFAFRDRMGRLCQLGSLSVSYLSARPKKPAVLFFEEAERRRPSAPS